MCTHTSRGCCRRWQGLALSTAHAVVCLASRHWSVYEHHSLGRLAFSGASTVLGILDALIRWPEVCSLLMKTELGRAGVARAYGSALVSQDL